MAVQRCIRLDPRDPALAFRLNHVAIGLYFSREYEAAVEASKRAIRSYPEFPLPYRWLAAALGPKTTPTCSKACARPACRRSEARLPHRVALALATDGPVGLLLPLVRPETGLLLIRTFWFVRLIPPNTG